MNSSISPNISPGIMTCTDYPITKARDKENASPTTERAGVQQKLLALLKARTAKGVVSKYFLNDDQIYYPKEYMTGTRYVARVELLKRAGRCLARPDLTKIPGKPRIVECIECGAIVHLGPIGAGITAFEEHLNMRHDSQDLELKDEDNEGGMAAKGGQEEGFNLLKKDSFYRGYVSEADNAEVQWEDGDLLEGFEPTSSANEEDI